MEKIRPFVLIVAIIFTFLYLQTVAPPQEPAQQTSSNPVEAPSTKATEPTPQPSLTPTQAPSVKPAQHIDIVDNITLENDQLKITISNAGAVVKRVELQTYFSDIEETLPLVLLDDSYGRASFAARLYNNAPPYALGDITAEQNLSHFHAPRRYRAYSQ